MNLAISTMPDSVCVILGCICKRSLSYIDLIFAGLVRSTANRSGYQGISMSEKIRNLDRFFGAFLIISVQASCYCYSILITTNRLHHI